MTIAFTKTSMNSGNVVNFTEFTDVLKAETFFKEVANELNIDNIEISENSAVKKFEAGGRGFDFLIELEIPKF